MTACIFDLDGVIVDTAKYHFLAWKRLAMELGVALTLEDNEKLKGVGRLESLNIILSMGQIELSNEEKEQLAQKKNSWFVEYIQAMKEEEIFPGAKNLFQELRIQQIKVGLASSSKNAKTVLKLLNIENEFEVVVDGNMISQSKPDPEIFLKAAALLKVSPEECIVVEDA
ncbi:MAG: beta-phosphoglucomutase, partial [Cyclobacteriaceae bacterium]|nr:beta-phosphoglucomutase [Cyclobacteriaceae bacterium]